MSDDNVITLGGKKYTPPENLEDRKELFDTVRSLDAERFRKFIIKNLPELVTAGWLDKTDEQLTLLLHEIRAQYIGHGDDFIKSRNHLRARQFGYSSEELADKPLCASCKWFREIPPGDERACMHMGSIPQDIACKSYEALPRN